jgi:hypothetical protein
MSGSIYQNIEVKFLDDTWAALAGMEDEAENTNGNTYV